MLRLPLSFSIIILNHFLLFPNILCANPTHPQQLESPPLKVLVYSPTLSWSHAQFLGKIADTLQKAGHEVHFLKYITSPELRVKNETRLVQKVWQIEKHANVQQEQISHRIERVLNAFQGTFPLMNALNHNLNDVMPLFAEICNDVASGRENLFEQLEAERFDVGIVEVYDFCPLAILHRAGVRVKLIAEAVPLYQQLARRFGIPTFSSFVPYMYLSDSAAPNFSFFGRFRNFYEDFYDWLLMDDYVLKSENHILIKAFGNDFPSIEEIVRDVSLVFVNSNPFFSLPRPLSNKIVHIGGLLTSPREGDDLKSTMEKNVAAICNNSKEGIVFISFGSIARTERMSAQMRLSILGAFSRFPNFQFIWKLENGSRHADSESFSAAPNVHTFEWLNQRALLNHPKMRAFISHCGWNSVQEAAEAGVPLLGVPLFYEQRYNLAVAAHRGMGLHLDVRELNGPEAEETLVLALNRVLFEEKFRQNAQEIKRKLEMSPFAPEENLVRWVEFAAKFPEGSLGELNLPGDEEIHWLVYYSLDVLLFSALIALSVLAIAFWETLKIARIFLFSFLMVVKRENETLMNSTSKPKEQ